MSSVLAFNNTTILSLAVAAAVFRLGTQFGNVMAPIHLIRIAIIFLLVFLIYLSLQPPLQSLIFKSASLFPLVVHCITHVINLTIQSTLYFQYAVQSFVQQLHQ